MLESVLMLILAAFVSYFIGTINFSKIIAWRARRKDITQIGSKNPGAMNMLRSFGFGLAFLTFVAEALKAGLTCFLFGLLYEHLGIWGGSEFVYYLAGFSLMIGYNFPVWSKFKGGKGVACFAGILLFSPIWYVSLGWFVVCFFLFLWIDIGSVISLTYTGGLTIATTIFFWLSGYSVWVASYIIAMIWALYILTLIRHRANFKRLLNHTENKAGILEKLRKMFKHKKGEKIIDESQVESEAEDEIVIDDTDKTSETEEVEITEEEKREKPQTEEIIVDEEDK